MVGQTCTPGEYITPTYYYLTEWGKDNWEKKLRDKIQLKKVTPPPSCQPLQDNPLRLIINDPHSMTTESSVLRCYVLRCYGLGANLIGNTDPTGSFHLELVKEPALMPCPQHYPTVPS
jgi:hypothetical protein